jgi:hypothetical protein
MAEELSSPHHYVACTGDYDCAADEHIEGCFIFDKRAADDHRQVGDDSDPYDRAIIDLACLDGTDHFVVRRGTVEYQYAGGDCVYKWQRHGPASLRRVPLDD